MKQTLLMNFLQRPVKTFEVLAYCVDGDYVAFQTVTRVALGQRAENLGHRVQMKNVDLIDETLVCIRCDATFTLNSYIYEFEADHRASLDSPLLTKACLNPW